MSGRFCYGFHGLNIVVLSLLAIYTFYPTLTVFSLTCYQSRAQTVDVVCKLAVIPEMLRHAFC